MWIYLRAISQEFLMDLIYIMYSEIALKNYYYIS